MPKLCAEQQVHGVPELGQGISESEDCNGVIINDLRLVPACKHGDLWCNKFEEWSLD